MKNLLAVFCVLAISFLIACGGGSSSADSSTESSSTEEMEMDKSGPEYTSAYICPMHCKGSGSAEPGKCPVCEMDYVANDGGDGHDHDHDHDHDHNH